MPQLRSTPPRPSAPPSLSSRCRRSRLFFVGSLLLADCAHDEPGWPSTSAPQLRDFCSSPGSVVFDDSGRRVVPGGDPGAPDLGWLTLPAGLCAHHFARVPTARQIRFAPGGELFVASPTTPTTGGGRDGLGAIVIVPDDDHDGVGDGVTTYLDGKGSTQGLLFVPGWFYYQDGTKIVRRSYQAGERVPSGSSELVEDIKIYVSVGHWPKSLDVTDEGTIYVSNGGDEGESCVDPHPFRGGILALDGTPGGNPVSQGMRNPIVVRCRRGHNRCFAAELSRDYSAREGGREKLVPVRKGDDWGYPCCASKDLPYSSLQPEPACNTVTGEDNSFLIGNTPFGIDFVPNGWPGRYLGNIIVTLHGEFGTWVGAKVVAIATDAATGIPLPSSTTGDVATGAITDFATGWDDGTKLHGRPADITFAPDGRLFIADDVGGEIFWIAPVIAPTRGAGVSSDAGESDRSPADGDGGSEAQGQGGDGSIGCATASVSLTADVQPIFTRYCTSCHGPPTPNEQLDLSAGLSKMALLNVDSLQCAGRPLVAPGDPERSYLLDKLQGRGLCGGSAPMPPSGTTLSTEEIATVRNWICMGAPDN